MAREVSDADLRRLWTLGKASLLWERKHKQSMTDQQHADLLSGRWKPDVSTEDLIEELRRDPFSRSKLGAIPELG